jgi:serine/threonine protein kinase
VTEGRFCPFCGTVAPPEGDVSDPYINQIVAQKYFIQQLIDTGGMGQVYKASQIPLERPVALKILKRSLLADPSIVQRFHREARAASRLNHPNSISVIDFGQMEDGTLYLAMEYLAGRNLHRLIAEEFPIAPARIVKIISQVLAALTEAHALGILHRDLKPENVMVDSRHDETDFVKVLDFGIAKIYEPGDPAAPRLTQQGMAPGTPGYMSPEQTRGEQLDARSDLYAVGVILYEFLAGRLPFEADTPLALAAKALVEVPVSPSERRPDLAIPPGLEALAMRAMSLDRNARPPSAEEFRRELLACPVPQARATPAAESVHKTVVYVPANVARPSRPPVAVEARPETAPLSTARFTPGASAALPPVVPTELARRSQTPHTGTPAPPGRMTPSQLPQLVAADGNRPLWGALVAAIRRQPALVATGAAAVLTIVGLLVFAVPRPPKPIVDSPLVKALAPVPLPDPVPPPPDVLDPARPPSGDEPSPAIDKDRPGRPVSDASPIRKVKHAINSIRQPAPSSGDGLLVIVATPWAKVRIDNREIGEAPCEVLIRAGTYRLHASHPDLGQTKATVDIAAGERKTWPVTFAR